MKPKLRSVHIQPIQHQGQAMLMLTDPLGLSTTTIAVPRPLGPVLMLMDGRYRVERWMKEYIPADAVIAAPEPLEYLPRLEGYRYRYLTPYLPDFLEKPKPEYIVLSTIHSGRHDPDTTEARFYAKFMEAPPRYRLVLKHRTRFPWLPLDFGSVPTNLDKINPEILIYKKHKEIEGAGGSLNR